MTPRTRFAPSPTGLLHLGGARTALFNYLFARHHGGKFLLRIEDTDRVRSTAEAIQAILDGLGWLEITPDEAPLYQSARQARHAEVANELLAAGHAYRCYCTPDELAAMRARAAAEGCAPRYDGTWRERDPATAPPGVAPAIRLKAPQSGETVIADLVQGEVRVANAELDDMIIQRSDGTPTYLHAAVVDDHDMGITHVIRGDDHLTNTFRQAQIYRAMGWAEPRFAHIPLIFGTDGTKLSKRHGAVSVLEFREQGYLPEAMCNYLLRLGWGHGDLEIIDREQAIELFDLPDVGRAPSRMDYAKLTHLNGVWLRRADDAWLTEEVCRRLEQRPGLNVDSAVRERIRKLMPELKERARTLAELAVASAFLAHPPPAEPKTAEMLAQALATLRASGEALGACGFSSREELHNWLYEFAEWQGLELGQVAQPLRAALTGSTASPPIDAVLFALGKKETLARIDATLASTKETLAHIESIIHDAIEENMKKAAEEAAKAGKKTDEER